ncbi:MAG: cellobiose phosphorylase, partial [Gemmatimonadetes bacterium]|nr:cellobiose phosphorylase [Gemmatimonadota bacterium]
MTRPRTTYALDLDTSSFVIKEYNWAPAFSNFLPGIAGAWGIPLWAYYVNRGQAMTSVGVRDKDGQILEFYSLNKAVMRIEREGFRTFVRIDGGPVYEPFRRTERNGISQTMIISSAELVLRERNDPLGLEIEVVYFTLPNLPVAAMARQVRLRNLAARRRRVEWLDGAARIIPFGVGLERSKAIPRHIEAMMGVWNFRGVPLFRLKQNPEDLAQVGSLSGGHFYLAAGARLGQGLVVDPDAVFGDEISRDRPWRFEREGAPGV